MLELKNYEEVNSSSGSSFPGAGVYACKIVKAVNNSEKKYVHLYLDICVGPYKGFAESAEEHFGQDWAYITTFLSYKPSALSFLKDKIDVIALSSKKNGKETWDDFKRTDGANLAGMYVGVIVGEKQYRKNDGTIGKKLDLPSQLIEAAEAKNNPQKYAELIPPIKLLEGESQQTASVPTVNNFDETPF